MAFVDYYEILGLDRSATVKDIKKRYKELARIFHPDMNPEREESLQKFQKINEAYAVLIDPDKRMKYDVYGEYWKLAEDLEKKKREESTAVGRRGFFKKLWRNQFPDSA